MGKAIARVLKVLGWGILAATVVAAGAIWLNRQWLVDWWQGKQYAPSAEMAEIRGKLGLTERGTFLFNAVRPVLNEAAEFNASCHQEPSETAVLGCYTDGQVRVYNITASELAGIREVTTAHEILHAAWARLKNSEREELAPALDTVLARNAEALKKELATYDATAQAEEVYVRAGTEIAELPAALEQHFADFFVERGKIVEYYNGYIAVFSEKEARAEALAAELPELRERIDTTIADYEARAEELQTKVQEFNSCAAREGCFQSQAEFMTQRTALLEEQQNLRTENSEINGLISSYNTKIEEYNQIVDDSRKLKQEINSNGLTEVEL